MDERALAERLITYDTSTLEGMQSAAGFIKGWLEARDVEVTGSMHNGRPVLAATVGPASAPTIPSRTRTPSCSRIAAVTISIAAIAPFMS